MSSRQATKSSGGVDALPLQDALTQLVDVHRRLLEVAESELRVMNNDVFRTLQEFAGSLSVIASHPDHIESDQIPVPRDSVETLLDAALAMQRQDFIEQRLQHVEHGLVEVLTLLARSPKALEGKDWQALLEKVRSGFSIEAERELFDEAFGLQPDEELKAASGDVDFF